MQVLITWFLNFFLFFRKKKKILSKKKSLKTVKKDAEWGLRWGQKCTKTFFFVVVVVNIKRCWTKWCKKNYWWKRKVEGNKNDLLQISVTLMVSLKKICLATLLLPLCSMFTCFVTAYIFQPDEIHETHCRVRIFIFSLRRVSSSKFFLNLGLQYNSVNKCDNRSFTTTLFMASFHCCSHWTTLFDCFHLHELLSQSATQWMQEFGCIKSLCSKATHQIVPLVKYDGSICAFGCNLCFKSRKLS